MRSSVPSSGVSSRAIVATNGPLASGGAITLTRNHPVSRLLKKAHLLRWRPHSHARRTESTSRVRATAASHLDLFEQPASFSASRWASSGRLGHGSAGQTLLDLAPRLV